MISAAAFGPQRLDLWFANERQLWSEGGAFGGLGSGREGGGRGPDASFGGPSSSAGRTVWEGSLGAALKAGAQTQSFEVDAWQGSVPHQITNGGGKG